MLELLQQNIKLNSSARGILIDGYPRTMQQVEQYQMHVRIFSHMLCMVQSIKFIISVAHCRLDFMVVQQFNNIYLLLNSFIFKAFECACRIKTNQCSKLSAG